METMEYTDNLYNLHAICQNFIAEFEARKIDIKSKMENCSPDMVDMYSKSIEHCDKFIEFYKNKSNDLKKQDKKVRSLCNG